MASRLTGARVNVAEPDLLQPTCRLTHLKGDFKSF
jgi:hypothetical protein